MGVGDGGEPVQRGLSMPGDCAQTKSSKPTVFKNQTTYFNRTRLSFLFHIVKYSILLDRYPSVINRGKWNEWSIGGGGILRGWGWKERSLRA